MIHLQDDLFNYVMSYLTLIDGLQLTKVCRLVRDRITQILWQPIRDPYSLFLYGTSQNHRGVLRYYHIDVGATSCHIRDILADISAKNREAERALKTVGSLGDYSYAGLDLLPLNVTTFERKQEAFRGNCLKFIPYALIQASATEGKEVGTMLLHEKMRSPDLFVATVKKIAALVKSPPLCSIFLIMHEGNIAFSTDLRKKIIERYNKGLAAARAIRLPASPSLPISTWDETHPSFASPIDINKACLMIALKDEWPSTPLCSA